MSDPAVDRLLGGRLSLLQAPTGHRAGTDAVLLAAAAGIPEGPFVDVGAGVGTAGLILEALGDGRLGKGWQSHGFFGVEKRPGYMYWPMPSSGSPGSRKLGKRLNSELTE